MSDRAIVEAVDGDEAADPEQHPFGRPTRRRPPKLFRGGGLDVVGTVVVKVSRSLGTYGMGGPGFLGFLVEGEPPMGQWWIVVTLWSAAGWATLDGALAGEALFADERAEAARSGRAVAELAAVVGARITGASCSDEVLTLEFSDADRTHRFEIRGDGRDVLPWRGNGEPRRLAAGESMRDAVVVSRSGYLWTADAASDDDAADAPPAS